jgi:hypothetical protein
MNDLNQQINDLINHSILKATIHTPLGNIDFEGTCSQLATELFTQNLIFGDDVSYTYLFNN